MSNALGKTVLTLMAVSISLIFLLPILWLMASALRPVAETFAGGANVDWYTIIPRQWTLENFQSALDKGFLRNLFNSLLVAGISVVLGLAISAMAAFALAVIRFPGRKPVFTAIVLSFLVPFEAIAIPLARNMADWGLTNTVTALILPGLGNGLAVFILRQFFLGVPYSLAEAAHMDGAGWWRIFWMIYLPLCRPALIGAGLILFLFQWQAYMWPILVVSQENLDLAPVSIAKSFGAFSTDYGSVFAQTTALALIPEGVLLVLQRYFVTSIASSGSKE
ncbi:carbohydrate ABC transporter permease [uncultured Devosia sp.]|uniref:carbohydrate ABC transporter permease n=1 Tax=uncultured Devosia sp. TaxID=211434 RepID=UPI0035CBD645